MTETTIGGVRPERPSISPNRIQANLLTFGRRLRDAGLPIGSGQILSLVDALATIDVFRHEDVYHAARASVVTRPEQIPVFDLEFSRFWRELLGAKPAPLDPFVPQNTPGDPPLPDASKKKTERQHTPESAEDEKDIFHVSESEDHAGADEEEFEASPDDVMLFSSRETLRRKDFSQCTADEIAEARRIIEGFTWRLGTRLTRITRELRKRDVDTALTDVVSSVEDWSGGTRIGEAIKSFNYQWARRVLRSGATVVIISDGWDRGDPELLGREMARLQRSCRRLIWLNPLLGAPGYQPLTQGMRAAMPYIDEFLPIHNLQSLEALADLLGQVEDKPPVRRFVLPSAAA